MQRCGEPPVSVGGQVARQRAGQPGNVPGEDQPPGRGLLPAPLDDVVDHPPGGEDPAAPLRCRQHRAGARVAGRCDGSQVRLDVPLAVQARQRGQRRVGAGDDAGEAGEPPGHVRDGGPGPGAAGAFQVGTQGGRDAAVNPLEVAGPFPAQVGGVLGGGRGQCAAQVVDDCPGGIQRGAIVLQRSPAAAFPDGDRLVEGGDIGVGQPGQDAAGLDEQPHGHQAGHAQADLLGVSELGCGGQETGQLITERARRRLSRSTERSLRASR